MKCKTFSKTTTSLGFAFFSLSVVALPEYTASEIRTDYTENEVKASLKYEDKRLIVSGQVAGFGKDFDNDPYVKLNHAILGPEAKFDKKLIEYVSSLHIGDQVRLMCTGKRKGVFSPRLAACVAVLKGYTGSKK